MNPGIAFLCRKLIMLKGVCLTSGFEIDPEGEAIQDILERLDQHRLSDEEKATVYAALAFPLTREAAMHETTMPF